MHFSRSIIVSALLGLAVATNHEGEAPAAAAAPAAEHATSAIAAPAAAHATSVVVESVAAVHAPSVAVVESVAAVHATSVVAAAAPPAMEHATSVVAAAPPPAMEHATSVMAAAPPPAVQHATSMAMPAAEHATSVAAAAPPAPPAAEHATSAIVALESVAASHVAPAAPPPAHVTGAAAAGTVATHVIQVGGSGNASAGLVFEPESITANPGDLVQFQFNPKNHSVVQSTFDQPCVPIQNIMANKTDAFFSGFMPTNASAVAAGTKLTYTIKVMDTKPIWFYCSQGMHCQQGMVGAINAPASGNRTMTGFKQLAQAAVANISPGQAAGQGAPAAPPSGAPGAAEPSGAGVGGGVDATNTALGGATVSSADNPAQQTTNAAGRVSQSLFGLAVTALAAFLVL